MAQSHMARVLRDVALVFLLVGFLQAAHRSTSMPAQQNETHAPHTFTVHEVEEVFLDKIATLAFQLDVMIYSLPNEQDYTQLTHDLRLLRAELDEIKQRYTKTSPATALLGPLGTAAIVLKEKDLEKQLLALVDKVGMLVHALIYEPGSERGYTRPHSVESGLAFNQEAINELFPTV